jgi:hypothetical protein
VIHTYRNASRGRSTPISEVIFATLFLAPAVALLYGMIFEAEARFSGAVWWVAFVAFLVLSVLWSWPVYETLFRCCYEIRVGDDATCQLRSPLRRTRLQAQEIISLYPGWVVNDECHTVLRYRGGRRFIVQPVEGFSDFLKRLRALNPNVDVQRLGTKDETACEDA